LGLALDESIENLENIESNGVSAYIDPKLMEMLKSEGNISVDFVSMNGNEGYSVRVGDPKDCGGCSC